MAFKIVIHTFTSSNNSQSITNEIEKEQDI